MKISEFHGQIEGDATGRWLLLLCNGRAKRFVNYLTATLLRRDLCGPQCAGIRNHRVVEITPENNSGKPGLSKSFQRMVAADEPRTFKPTINGVPEGPFKKA